MKTGHIPSPRGCVRKAMPSGEAGCLSGAPERKPLCLIAQLLAHRPGLLDEPRSFLRFWLLTDRPVRRDPQAELLAGRAPGWGLRPPGLTVGAHRWEDSSFLTVISVNVPERERKPSGVLIEGSVALVKPLAFSWRAEWLPGEGAGSRPHRSVPAEPAARSLPFIRGLQWRTALRAEPPPWTADTEHWWPYSPGDTAVPEQPG